MAATSVPGIAKAYVNQTQSKESGAEMKLGVASYTLREFSREQALEMTLRCGVNRITFKSMHLPLESDQETINNAIAQCKEKGLLLYGGGVIAIRTKVVAV